MINWFARNGVAANLLMLLMVIGGFLSFFVIKKELFPSFSLGTIIVRVPYLGASPEEVEEAVVIRVEEALEGLDGLKEVSSVAAENFGAITITVSKGFDVTKVKEEIKTRVDAITTFPVETERPIIEELIIPKDVLWISISGEADERSLKNMAERMRDELVKISGISQVLVQGVRDYEVSIEVSEMKLREYGISFSDVEHAVRQNSFDMPGGIIKSDGGEISLRTKAQAYTGADFESIIVLSKLDGTTVRVKDIGVVVDGFTDSNIISRFNGKSAASLLVREVGEENPLHISKKVREYIEESQKVWLPEGIDVDVWADISFYLQGRLDLLINNGMVGFFLVLICLALFLRPTLAIFVAIGIPVSFLATFLVGQYIGLTINLMSLFAFILVLGIVVDDAIVVGESVFSEYQRNGPGVESSVRGTHAVSVPVTFAVLTTMVAFLPIFFLPGFMGKFFITIPLVVIPTLAFSLVQSKLVLPYHLTLCKVGDKGHRDELNVLSRFQRRFSDGLETFIHTKYKAILVQVIKFRWLTLSAFTSLFIIAIGLVVVGWIRFVFFPSVPSDYIIMSLTMPEGTTIYETQRAMTRVEGALAEISTEALERGEGDPVKHQSLYVGFSSFGGGPNPESVSYGSNIGSMVLEMSKSEIRDSDAFEVAELWRKKVGQIPGARSMTFHADAAGPVGRPVDVHLTGPDFDELKKASLEIQEKLKGFNGLYDILDTYAEGKQEIKLSLNDHARSLGLTSQDLAIQVRQAFYGAEAQRIQRNRDDVRIMVRYPKEERESLGFFERMRIRTPLGTEVPISEVANLEVGNAYPVISRLDKQRVVRVQAAADKDVADIRAINKMLYPISGVDAFFIRLSGEEVPVSITEEVLKNYQGITAFKGGEAKDMAEMAPALLGSMVIVVLLIYMLLAIPFKSYVQPLLVISVIPFGIAGAIFGHAIPFFRAPQDLSILSFLGIIALTGVVVNDSLVLVDYINKIRREGMPLYEAVLQGGVRRFRPIILTSITTFVGLVPILLERSLQAQFLIPMATSLAFGVLFATFLTLLLVPALYLILEDVTRWFMMWLRGFLALFGVHLDQPETEGN